MSRKASTTIIGAFTLIGIALAFAAVFLVSGGRFFDQRSRLVLFFDKSINGLFVGSDVRFGGVLIGRVVEVDVLVDVENNRKIIPVVVEVMRSRVSGMTSGDMSCDFSTREGVAEAVETGLRARLTQQSLVTGVLYVEFDIVPGSEGLVYDAEISERYPVVPTMPMEFDELIAAIGEGLRKINSLDLDSVIVDLRTVLRNMNHQLSQLDLKHLNENLVRITEDIKTVTGDENWKDVPRNVSAAIKDLNEAIAKINEAVGPLTENVDKAVQAAERSLVKVEEAAGGVADFTNPRSPAMLRMQNALLELERAARSIRELAEDLQRQPGTLIKGKEVEP